MTVAAAVAVGVIGTRTINSDNDNDNDRSAGAAVLIEGDLDDVRAIPLLGPTGGAVPDLGVGDEGVPVIGGSPVIGGVFGPGLEIPEGDPDPGGVSFSDPLMVYDEIEGIGRLPERAFDVCAGPEPGALPGVECPEGYAGTLLGLHMVPDPFVWGTPGRYLTAPGAPFPSACPTSTPVGEDHNAITVFSRTPLDALTVKWRQYGTAYEPWVSVTAPSTPVAERAAWMARFEDEEYSREAFGFLTLCGILIDRDPDLAYEVVLEATDSFGRPVSSRPFLMPGDAPTGRPPTEVLISERAAEARVTAWTHEGGLVTVGVVPYGDPLSDGVPEVGECDLGAPGTVDASDIHFRDGSRPSPSGLYDVAFTRKAETSIPLTPGAWALICVTIYETNNTLRPRATDGFVVQGPAAVLPRIELTSIAFTEPRRLVVGEELTIRVGTSAEACGAPWQSDRDFSASDSIIHTWSCVGMATSPTEIATWTLPIAISRIHEGRLLSQASAISLNYNLDPGLEESFLVPIPPDNPRLCGGSFGDESRCPQPGEGWAQIIVRYDAVGAAGNGFVTPWGTTDGRAAIEPVLPPRLGLLAGEVTNSDDWNSIDINLSIGADRPITLETVRVVANELTVGSEAQCGTERTIDVGSSPATEFEIAANICAGVGYAVLANYTDAEGIAHESLVGGTQILVQASLITVWVEFNGGDAPPFGWLHRYGIGLEVGRRANTGDLTGPTGAAGPQCRSLDDTFGEFFFRDLTVIGSLEVGLTGRISTTGDTDCEGRPDTGFDFRVEGAVTLDQLHTASRHDQALFFHSPDDAPLQIRLIVFGDFHLGDLIVV